MKYLACRTPESARRGVVVFLGIVAAGLVGLPGCGGSGAVTITKDNFDEVVGKSDKPVLLDFWADWCGPCKAMDPAIRELAREMAGEAVVGKVNIDEQPELSEGFLIESLPTFIIVKNGKTVRRLVGGGRTKEELAAQIRAAK